MSDQEVRKQLKEHLASAQAQLAMKREMERKQKTQGTGSNISGLLRIIGLGYKALGTALGIGNRIWGSSNAKVVFQSI